MAPKKGTSSSSVSPQNASEDGDSRSAGTIVPMSRQSSAAISDEPATEDYGELLAPDAAVEEEHRLQEEREKIEAQQQAAKPCEPVILPKTKFSRLEELITTASHYSMFLGEHMTATEEWLEMNATQTEAPVADEATGRKRKGRQQRGGAEKKQKASSGTVATNSQSEEQNPVLKALCPGFVGNLRDYQIRGVRWLICLFQNGLGGILADEMGLGKTVQTIAFLCHLRSQSVHGPYIIVGPLSTLPNWVNEFHKWAPDMPVCLYHGTKDERARLRETELRFTPGKIVPPSFPIICTSFEIVISDRKFFERFPKFQYVIVDEGHRLKNTNCKLIRELRCLSADNRLLLTGTPLQNNLSELWSLLNYMLPDIFSDVTEFESWFDFEGMVGQAGGKEKLAAMEQRNQVVSKLHFILKPFVLRRLKSDVVQNMPGKTEIILYAPMTQKQKEINQHLRDKTLQELAKTEGGSRNSGSLNNMMMQMRKNCNHPDLLIGGLDGDHMYPDPETMLQQCGKFQLLDRLLNKLKAGNHKVLIFSQMTKLLDLLESFLSQRGEEPCRLDGSTDYKTRQANIDAFNKTDQHWIFLLSTRAGGLGINLTAADTVILYDSDWNPQMDLQAMDRAHRLGQTRPVLVFRLATAHSFEGRMLKRAADKLALERVVMKKGEFAETGDGASAPALTKQLPAEELLALLQDDVSLADEAQSAVVNDEMLEKLLDRRISAHQDSMTGGVVHSFTGGMHELSELLAIPQLAIGINGCSLKSEANLDVSAAIPPHRLMLETDAPWCDIRPTHAGQRYLATQPSGAPAEVANIAMTVAKDRKKHDSSCRVKGRNEPQSMLQVLLVVAVHRGLTQWRDVQRLAEQVHANTTAMFFSSPR